LSEGIDISTQADDSSSEGIDTSTQADDSSSEGIDTSTQADDTLNLIQKLSGGKSLIPSPSPKEKGAN